MNRFEKSKIAWQWQRGLIDEGWVRIFTKAEDKLARYISYVVDWDKGLLWGSARGIQEKVGISYRVVSWVEAKFLGYGLFDGWGIGKVRGQPQHILRVAFPVPKLDMERVIKVRTSLSHLKGNSWEKLTVALREKGLLHYSSSELLHFRRNISFRNSEIEQSSDIEKEKGNFPEWLEEKKKKYPITKEMMGEWMVKTGGTSYDFIRKYETIEEFVGIRK